MDHAAGVGFTPAGALTVLTPLFSALSPPGARGRLSILIFHRVLATTDPLFPDEVDARRFDGICSWIKRWFKVLPLDEAVSRLKARTLPARAMSITFDDGYEDNFSVALPILQRHRLSASFFIATGFLDGGIMWNDVIIESVRRCEMAQLDLQGTPAGGLGLLPLASLVDRCAAIERIIGQTKYLSPRERTDWTAAVHQRSGTALPTGLMMSSEQVRSLHRAGMGIGGHTVSHPILAALDARQAQAEIADGRHRLEAIVGERVGLFAYPNGRPDIDYGPEAVRVVRELGFDAAVSTSWGAARAGDDCFQLPRFTPWDRTRARFGLRMARHLVSS
jgi:peptidoglycan/xylan/chitin deacetylase (PgdA/CDA1 family)